MEQIERRSGKTICVIFLVAVDEFDTMFLEGGVEKNRLQKSAELFNLVRSFNWLRETSFILFLNKTDVFKEKIQTINIADHFPQFEGFSRDYESGIQFIENLYVPNSRQNRNRNKIFPHKTCATDTCQMARIITSVKDTILKFYIKSIM